ncbi:hypothetical protein K4F52_005737 [Lecanicillium sp. MT-2017a]|nr:hypothetical protein K4F52_005737 [Lecanicillium sp. MT-2017a]
MTDDSSSPARRPSLHTTGNGKASSNTAGAVSSGISAPAGHAFRRTKTVDESMLPTRRRTPTRRFSSDSAFEPPPVPPRRSSNFSEISLNEARDILNPQARQTSSVESSLPESSSLASLSLAFALLPAISGALFKNGGAIVTDIMLLGLAGVFLHWSVTQPWLWYHSAQEVRIQHEANAAEAAVEDDSDFESAETSPAHLDDVPEEDDTDEKGDAQAAAADGPMSPQQQSALSELYLHEVLALLSCLLLPLASAYLLHAIRSQLSRPSEGLVSNYNLTIFLLLSELRVLSHMIKLVQARTLHLQRVVHGNPFGAQLPSSSQISSILERLEELESRSLTTSAVLVEEDAETESAKATQEATMTKEVRNAIQPELDALNRAVRRYEKKSTVLQSHVETRFSAIDARLDDAIALAAAAAKNSANSNIVVRALEGIMSLILFPFNAVLQILLLPLKSLLALTGRGGKKKNVPASTKQTRSARGSKVSGQQQRYGSDRMPTRLARK